MNISIYEMLIASYFITLKNAICSELCVSSYFFKISAKV